MASLIVPQAAPASRYDDPGIIETIRQTVAKGASDSELRMFLEVCKATGLNPFLKEIWYVAATKTIMAGRDGYLRKANEDPMFDGMETRVERDSNNIPVKATCTVWRKDRTHPILCEAYYSEYKKSGNVWNQYPSAMIAKVAEVLALKRSFSINGVVTQEEIGEEDGTPHVGRGSKEAAQAAAHRQLAQFEKDRIAREAAAMVVEEPHYEVVPEERPDNRFYRTAEPPTDEPGLQPQHADQLAASVALAHEQRFRTLYDGYTALGKVKRYHAQIKSFGVKVYSDFDITTKPGQAQADRCFSAMTRDLSELEEQLAQKATDTDVPF